MSADEPKASAGKVKVEIVTIRRALLVRTGYLHGSADRVDVDVCVTCGAIVFDAPLHDRWHMGKEGRSDG